MLTHINPRINSNIPAVFRQNCFNLLTRDYRFKIKPNLKRHGLRYLHYTDKHKELFVSDLSSGNLYILNLCTGKMRVLPLHQSTIRKIEYREGKIFTASWDGSVGITDYYTLEQRKLTDRFMGRCPYFNITPDGRYLYSFSYDSDYFSLGSEYLNMVRKWSTESGKLLQLLKATAVQKPFEKSGSIAFIDNARVFVCCDSGYVRTFDMQTGGLINEIVMPHHFGSTLALEKYKMILLLDKSGYMHLYNTTTCQFDLKMKAHPSSILCARLSTLHPDILITTCITGQIKIWKIPELALLETIETRSYELWSIAFINNRMLVSDIFGRIHVYNTDDLTNIHLKGCIHIFQNSFVVKPAETEMFYTDDISSIEVVLKTSGELVTGKTAEHLLAQGNDLKVLRELLGFKDDGELIDNPFNKSVGLLPAPINNKEL